MGKAVAAVGASYGANLWIDSLLSSYAPVVSLYLSFSAIGSLYFTCCLRYTHGGGAEITRASDWSCKGVAGGLFW